MIRAAAKNHDFVTIITDASDYQTVLDDMAKSGTDGGVSEATRRRLAAKAFAHTAHYDSTISGWMRDQGEDDALPQNLSLGGELIQMMRYGENPHQDAGLYRIASRTPRPGVLNAEQIQGKPLSFNNINDTDAFELVAEFDAPSIAIIKHANPCGVASHNDLTQAWQAALASDPVSAFGGIIALNRPLTSSLAKEITSIFTEVVIAPDADDEAKAIMAAKLNLRLLLTHDMPDPAAADWCSATSLAGFWPKAVTKASLSSLDLKCVTKRQPSESEMRDLIFAMTVAKHVKSNAIVYAKDKATVGIGAGQMSRLIEPHRRQKSEDLAENKGLDQSPVIDLWWRQMRFSHLLMVCAPPMLAQLRLFSRGGSVKDDDVIAAADDAGWPWSSPECAILGTKISGVIICHNDLGVF